jgi:hypothetical protein
MNEKEKNRQGGNKQTRKKKKSEKDLFLQTKSSIGNLNTKNNLFRLVGRIYG